MTETLERLKVAMADRYRLERELGRGGMATVYLAEDLRNHRRVAVKVLNPEMSQSLGTDRFLREIQIAARLTHPHILPLFDSGEADGHLYYVTPYVEGQSLRHRLEHERQLPLSDTIGIVQAVASALDYAHGQGVVHRDIKPENILLSGSGVRGHLMHPIVADFGIARAMDAAGGAQLTETGLVLGTPAYMSPEQAASGGHLDGRSDIYALGCVTYEMLAGSPPFTGATAQAIMARHAVDPVPSLRTVRGKVPVVVEIAVERALAKVPADRFPTATEFAEALTAEEGRARRARRITPARAFLLASLAASLVAMVTAIAFRKPSAPPVTPSASKIAVLPLRSVGDDSGLTQLGRDLAITVSASLDGIGGITTIDRLRLARGMDEWEVSSPGEASALARRLGAGSALLGTLVGDGPNVRLDLALYDAASVAPLAQGITVVANRDSLGALTDSVVWGLLRRVWERGEPPTPSLAAVTTRSVPALRAFLEGEWHVENDDWDAASLAYSSAIASDSTFWLARYRYALAQGWRSREIDPGFSDELYRHRNVLPERDRLLIEAWALRDSLPAYLKRLQAVAQRFPDYWPAWLLLGDGLYHVGPFLGYNWRDAQSALIRTVSLNPKLRPAWDHLLHNSIGRDTVESGRAAAGLRQHSQNSANEQAEDRDYYFVLLDAVSRSARITPELSALADSAAAAGTKIRFLYLGLPAAQIEFNRRVLPREPDRATAANLHRQIAWAWAQRGAWDSALPAFREAMEVEPNSVSAVDEYELAVLGVWLGALDVAEAVTRRPAAQALVHRIQHPEWRAEMPGQLAWFDGILAFASQDRSGLDRARENVRRSGHSKSSILDRSLAAFGLALAGQRAAAGRELAELEWQCVSRWQSCGDFYPHSPSPAIQRLAAANWLLEAGDTARASQLLTWHEAAVTHEWSFSLTYGARPLAYLMQARLEEGQGNTPSAKEHYEQFLKLYDLPMPGQRHLVDEASTALERLGGRGKPDAED